MSTPLSRLKRAADTLTRGGGVAGITLGTDITAALAAVEALRVVGEKLHWHPDPNVRDEPNAAEEELDAAFVALAALDREE